jgi:hypothetical protein
MQAQFERLDAGTEELLQEVQLFQLLSQFEGPDEEDRERLLGPTNPFRKPLLILNQRC